MRICHRLNLQEWIYFAIFIGQASLIVLGGRDGRGQCANVGAGFAPHLKRTNSFMVIKAQWEGWGEKNGNVCAVVYVLRVYL